MAGLVEIIVATLRNVRVQCTELANQKPLLQLLIIVGRMQPSKINNTCRRFEYHSIIGMQDLILAMTHDEIINTRKNDENNLGGNNQRNNDKLVCPKFQPLYFDLD